MDRRAVCNFRSRVVGLAADCAPTAVGILLSWAGRCLCVAFRLFRRHPVGAAVRARGFNRGAAGRT